MTGNLNYDAVGATRPSDQTWAQEPPGFRSYERSVRLGSGTALWKRVTDEVLDWGVKTRSGFTVEPVTGNTSRVRVGEDYLLTAHLGPFQIKEPVRVVAVVEGPDRCGFAYGTLPGHRSPVKKPSSSTAPQTGASG